MDPQPPHAPLTEEYLREHTTGELTPRSEPIRLVDYDPEWARRFEHEADRVRGVLGERARQLEHVGSTAVPGLAAKPVIDMVLVVRDSARESDYVSPLEAAGYRLHIREPGWHQHRLFKSRDGAVNLHVFSAGC